MPKRILSFIVLLLLAGLVLPSSTRAEQPTSDSPDWQIEQLEELASHSRRAREKLNIPAEVQLPSELRSRNPNEHVNVLVELQDEPTVVVWSRTRASRSLASANAVATMHAQKVQQAQERLLPQVQQLGAKVIYRVHRVLNGIAVNVPISKIDALSKLPSVKAVRYITPMTVEHQSSVPLIGAPEVWNGITGLDALGDGITVGVLDTGIDYIHTNFGGSGLKSDYTNNDTTADETDDSFPSAKVVGGYDFAGDGYDASDPAKSVPAPDEDPMDCHGHGTHVAGTVAGLGVNADGTTYTGPYTGTIDYDSLKIGPGVAPRALLYALRVFGCAGSTDLVAEALDWAMSPDGDEDYSDHLDVVNMSLGAQYGGYAQDPSIEASNNAALAGVVVVASAGNSGDVFYVTGSPASSDRAISVASSFDARNTYDGFRINTPADPDVAGVYPSSNSVRYEWSESDPVTGTVVYPVNDPSTPSNEPEQVSGCRPFNDANQALLNGKIALLDWTFNAFGGHECGSATRTGNAYAAGAIGVIMVWPGTSIDIAISGAEEIPATITNQPTGNLIKEQLAADEEVSATLTDEYNGSVVLETPELVDTLSSFTSRGPRRGDSALKPDIAAPGQTILSAASGTGSEAVSFNGTSMAAPHVAGSMALLRQLHPDWSVTELKALAMNTAGVQTHTAEGTPYSPSRQGAGRIEVAAAATSPVIAYNGDKPKLVSVSFGAPQVVSAETYTSAIRLENKNDISITYDVAVTEVVTSSGVSVDPSATSITVAGGDASDLQLDVSVDPAALDRSLDPASTANPVFGRHFLNEHSGYVTFTPTSGNYTANMANPQQETNATGQAIFDYNSGVLTYTVKLANITDVTAAHIHYASDGSVAYPLCDTNGPPPVSQCSDSGFEGVTAITPEDAELLSTGELYVNVHTDAYSGGEIRGTVAALPALKVPFYIAPRPASDMSAAVNSLEIGTAVTATLPLSGTVVENGAYPPLVWALELQEISPNMTETVGLQESGDLQYIGVGSNITSTSVLTDSTEIYFGLSTYGAHSSADPYDSYYEIYVDTSPLSPTSEFEPEYLIFNFTIGGLFGSDADDVFATFTYDLVNGSFTGFGFLNALSPALETAPFNSSVMVMPTTAGALGLTSGNSRFEYAVIAYNRDVMYGGVPSDISETHSFDPAKPAVTASGGLNGAPVRLDISETAIPITINRQSLDADQPLGLLLLHHLNQADKQAEVVTLENITRTIYLPVIINPQSDQ